MSRYLNDGLRCIVCDWCNQTGGRSTYDDTSGRVGKDGAGSSSEKWAGSIVNHLSKEKISPDIILPTKTGNRVIIDIDGKPRCAKCRQSARANLSDIKFLTEEDKEDTLRRIDKLQTGSYLDVIDDQIVEVKTYKATHPKLRSKLTEQEKESWREEYQKSLKKS